MVEKQEKTNIYLLSIVGIVAIIGIVILVLNVGREESAQAVSATGSEIELSDPSAPHEGLNFFVLSSQDGIIKGAYIEGVYRVDFEAVRTELRVELDYMLETGQIYQIDACYIGKKGDPRKVSNSCSADPKNPSEAIQHEMDRNVISKEFQLVMLTANELSTISLPGLEHEKNALIELGSSQQLMRDDLVAAHASSE